MEDLRFDPHQPASLCKIGGLRRIPHTAIEEYLTRLMEEVA
jgi:hypothetical protein